MNMPFAFYCNQDSALRQFALSHCTCQIAPKFVNNDSYLLAIDSTDLCKDMTDMMDMPCGPFHFPPDIFRM